MRFCLFILIFFVATAGAAEKRHSVSKKDRQAAAQEFERALAFEKAGKVDEALEAANRAVELFPSNSEYITAREALRQQIVGRLLQRGNRLVDAGDATGAAAVFREALEMDPENTYIKQRLQDVLPTNDADGRRTLQLLASVDQIDVAPSPSPASIHVRGDTRSVYTQIARTFGVTVRFDDAVPSRQLQIDLDKVDFYTAMQIAGKMSKTFWAPLSKDEVIVAADTPDTRRQWQRMSLQTFYVGNAVSNTELTDLVNVLRNIFEITIVSVAPSHNTITVRAPRETVAAAASLIENVMDARPEILLDVQELEFDTDKTSHYGLTLPTSFQVFNIPSEIRRVLGADAQAVIDQLNKTGTINPASIPLSVLSSLQGSPLIAPFVFFGKGLGLTGITTNPISGALSSSSSSSKAMEHVTLRAMDGESAKFRLGDRFPILSGLFSGVSLGTQGNAQLSSAPQFQYQDLGLTLNVKPHYHSDGEITLDMELEIVGLGTASLNNIPQLTNRSFKGNITVKEGEPSVVMGAVTDSELRATQGYPGLGQVPGLSPVFNNNTRQRDHNQIMVVVTPRVIRKPFHGRGTGTFWNLSQ